MAYGSVSPEAPRPRRSIAWTVRRAAEHRADDAERRVVAGRAVDEDERRPVAGREHGDRRAVGRGDDEVRLGHPGGARQRGSRAAAASSRIQVAPGRLASWPGQRRGSRSAPRTSPRARRPCPRRRPRPGSPGRRRARAGFRVTRSICGSMWVGAGIARARSGESSAGEPGKTDSRWPSGADPEEQEVEHRPAVLFLEARPPGARRRARRRTTRHRAPRRSPRRSGRGGRGRPGAARPAGRRRRCPPRAGRCRA